MVLRKTYLLRILSLGLPVILNLLDGGWSAAATCASPASGLAGWWTGEGNANDLVSTNNGSLQGGATASGAGMVGSSFTFDGTNSYVQIPDASALRPTNLTVECWVRFNSLNSAGSGGSPAGDQYMVFKQNSRSSNFEGFSLGKTRIGGGDVFELLISSAAGSSVDLQGTNFISTNVWYHVAGVRGSNFVQLYVNGQLQAQGTIAFAQDYGAQPLLFGTTGQSSWDHKLNGSLDEVSLYNRALASNEISAVFLAGAAGKCPGLVISLGPQSQTAPAGTNVSLNVTASGSPPLAYQWQRSSTNLTNGGNLSGANSATMTLTNVQPADGGGYRVVVTNANGAVTSTVALLTITAPTLAQITNLAATNIQATSAQLNGQILATGGNTPMVDFFYGAADGGTNAAAWAQSISLGAQTAVFGQIVSGLAPSNTYYFTSRAVNAAGTNWAAPSRTFSTIAAIPPLQRLANTTLAMPPFPPTSGYSLTNAFGTLNFLDPVCIASPPGETNRIFVVERGGTIAVITNLAAPTRTVFLDISGKVNASLEECGLLSLVFHPGYASNGFFFVWYYGPDTTAAGTGAHDILSRYTVSAGNSNAANSASEVKFIRQFDENQFHNAGDMHFGPDGYLYLSLGDEGGANGQYNNDQRIDKDLFSGLIRIDVNKKAGSLAPNAHAAATTNYTIPSDNPFIGYTSFNGLSVNSTNVRTEFWAVGMRNPWRWNFDPPTGRLYLGDVGQDTQEEVDIVVKGGNYGWAYAEGCSAGPKSPPGGFSAIAPIACYSHGAGSNQGYCIIGGPVYHGTQLSQLAGAYIYGDNVSGNVWSLNYNGTNVTSMQTLISAGAVGLSSFGIDPRNGEVLLAIRGVEGSSSTTQPLKRLIYSSTNSGPPLPATLNDTGAFSDLASLTPNAGIVPYEINLPFWSDNAIKSRWFSIPNTNLSIGYNPSNNWSFPTGTVWIKHFDLQTNSSPPGTTRLETRLLVRNTNGVYGVTYRWAGGTNAALVPEGGMDDSFVINNGGILTTQIWHYPSRSECLSCHTAIAGHALGLNAPQMDRDVAYPGSTTNQLQALSDAGYFNAAVTGIPSVSALAAPTNNSASLEYRSRSYLFANCAQCHQPGGAALGLWDARMSTPMAQCGLTNGALINNLGDTNNCVIKLGSLSNSVLLTRVANLGNLHMPPLATSVINTQAVQLLSAWITNSAGSAQLAVSPSGLDFGLVASGGAAQGMFVLTNLSGTALTNGVAIINGGPFTILSGTPFNLAGFGATNLVLRFAPTNAGNFTNSVVVSSGNGGNSTNQLTGSSAAPPGANFAGNPTSGLAPLNVSFTNTSTGSISNALWDFGDGVTTNTTVGTLTHNYTGAGTNTVVLTVSSPLGTNTLARTNYIVATNLPPQLTLTPLNLDFASLVVGQTSTQSFQVINSGGMILTGSAATLPPFAVQSGSPFSVPSGQTGLVSVSFSPTNASSFSNAVIFTSNAGNRTNWASGTGLTPAQLAVSPVTLDFGLVPVGSNVQAFFTVTNQGGALMTNGVAAVNSGPFTILSGTPFSLPGFGATNLVLRFAPTNEGRFTNSAVLASGNGGNATNLLTGSAAVPPRADFTATPTNGDWPLIVSFTDLSTGTISNSFWDFGDGVTTNMTAPAVTHNYPGLGTNTVSLTVTGPLGTNTLTRSNYIVVTNVPPVTLSIVIMSNQVQLTWGEGTLQSAGLITDPYTNLPAATSPYPIPPSEAARFFRVKVR